ncbi:MAG: M48 family metalloprotease [Allosphingosinicella sp.]|uniref:M48 family metalloprotease n=1 Tax=Allosphingosinicella sp. TaxID=2823234 RepID=UPI003945487B
MFAVAFQLLMAVGLAIPLLLFDPAHTPIYVPAAYARRYLVWVLLLSLLLFAAQMWWFVGTVHRQTRFRYVDGDDEPRFCRILEPLAIAAGIRTPFAGVIETSAMNAFACGVRDRHMVVVATRGLIDGLDDDELAAVLANAIVHIRNRDTRLFAAATVFMRNMTVMQGGRGLRLDHPLQVLPLVIFPVFLPLMLVFGFLIQIAFRLGYGSRALIGISRELIADAEAVRLTHNPAALASALHKMEQRCAANEFRDEYASMLMFGPTEGPLATHPTRGERVGALARTTGSMVLDTSSRLDTRPSGGRRESDPGWHPDKETERIALLAACAPRRGFWGAFRSARDPERNLLGLNRKAVLIVALSLVGIGFIHQDSIRQPDRLNQLFDIATARQFSGLGLTHSRCLFAFTASAEEQERCDKEAAEAFRLFEILPGTRGPREHLTFTQIAARDYRTRVERGCFTGTWEGADRSGRPPPAPLHALLADSSEAASRVVASSRAERDRRLIAYAQTRLHLAEASLRFFGEDGFEVFVRSAETKEHRTAIDALATRVTDPAFLAREPASLRANIALLATGPGNPRPCWAPPEDNRAMPSTLVSASSL